MASSATQSIRTKAPEAGIVLHFAANTALGLEATTGSIQVRLKLIKVSVFWEGEGATYRPRFFHRSGKGTGGGCGALEVEHCPYGAIYIIITFNHVTTWQLLQ